MSTDKPWSDLDTKTTPVGGDILAILDSEDSDPNTKNKIITLNSIPEFSTLNDLLDVTIISQKTGDLLFANSTTSWENLNPGVDGQVLILAGGVPNWGNSSQTPWMTDIDGATFQLLDTGNVGLGTVTPDIIGNAGSAPGTFMQIFSSTDVACLSLVGNSNGTAGAKIVLYDDNPVTPDAERWFQISNQDGKTEFLLNDDTGTLTHFCMDFNHSNGEIDFFQNLSIIQTDVDAAILVDFTGNHTTHPIATGTDIVDLEFHDFDDLGTNRLYAQIAVEVGDDDNTNLSGQLHLQVTEDNTPVQYISMNKDNIHNVIFARALDMNGQNKIIQVVDPTNPQDAATMNYVDTQGFLTSVDLNDLGDVVVAGYAAGEILYASSASQWDNLVAGTEGQQLTAHGAAAPTWEDAAISVIAGTGLSFTGNTLNVGAGSGIAVNATDIDVTFIGFSADAALQMNTNNILDATNVQADSFEVINQDSGGNPTLTSNNDTFGSITISHSLGLGTDTPESILNAGDTTGVIINLKENTVATEACIAIQGKGAGLLSLIDQDANADEKWFVLTSSGGQTSMGVLNDDGTDKHTCIIFDHVNGEIDFLQNLDLIKDDATGTFTFMAAHSSPVATDIIAEVIFNDFDNLSGERTYARLSGEISDPLNTNLGGAMQFQVAEASVMETYMSFNLSDSQQIEIARDVVLNSTNQIKLMAEPTDSKDATTKNYVDTQGFLTTVALNDLTDVEVPTPVDGDILVYDGVTNNRWDNVQGVISSITGLGTQVQDLVMGGFDISGVGIISTPNAITSLTGLNLGNVERVAWAKADITEVNGVDNIGGTNTGYVTGEAVTLTGGSGSGFVGTVYETGGVFTGLRITAVGTGYIDGEAVTITTSSSSNATADIVAANQISIIYDANDTLQFTDATDTMHMHIEAGSFHAINSLHQLRLVSGPSAGVEVALGTDEGNFIAGNSTSILVGRDDGFLYLPISDGAPTGTTVTAITNTVPITYDTTNDSMYAYNNGAWVEIGAGEAVIQTVLAADATEESITGTSLTQVKDMSFIKGVIDFQLLTIEIDMKTDNAGTTAHCRVRHDSLGGDDLDLTTVSTSYEVLSGTIDVSSFSAGRHTLEFYLEDGSGDTVTLRETWVFGKE